MDKIKRLKEFGMLQEFSDVALDELVGVIRLDSDVNACNVVEVLRLEVTV